MKMLARMILAVSLLIAAAPIAQSQRQAEPGVPMDLLKAQVASARRAYEMSRLMFRERVPNSDLENLYLWSVRWLNAERDLSKKPAERVAAAEAHLERMKAVEAMAKQLAKTEAGGERYPAAAEFYRVQAPDLAVAG
jgi:hypothetical protein